MAEAVSEYERYRDATDNWALGRFVVALSRWNELETCVRDLPRQDQPWPVSLLAAPADSDRIRRLRIGESPLVVQAVECRAASLSEAARAGEIARLGIEVFVEPSMIADLDSFAAELARSGVAAKIRTGGITADAFPTAREVLSFLRACQKARIRFKATAGLHHAVRGEYHLTFEASPPTGLMFGFLNIAMAAAFLWFGRGDDVILDILEERSVNAFELTDGVATWRRERLTREQLDEVRAAFFVGFGSCSFREPMAEIGLEALPRA